MNRRQLVNALAASTALAAARPVGARSAEHTPHPRPGHEPFAVSPRELFAERRAQFVAWGIPAAAVDLAAERIHDTWSDDPGGWPHEWTRIAEDFERRGELLTAAMCFGAARFPVAASPLRAAAYRHQLRCFLGAAPSLPIRVQRHELSVPYRGGHTPVAVHEYMAPAPDAPLVVASGGVDTFKVEMHRLCSFLAGVAGCRVAVLDMPGTGESPLTLQEDADRVYAGVLAALRGTARRTGAFGVSFGGHWSLRLALARDVDFAVSIGGPTGYAPAQRGVNLPNGMGGILRAALGMPQSTGPDAFVARVSRYTLEGLHVDDAAPLLVINGEHDPYVPPQSYARLAGARDATVWIAKNDAHCAPATLGKLLPAVSAWLRNATDPTEHAKQQLRALETSLVRPLLSGAPS